MQKAYSRILWENYPSTETPINETNLNKIDSGLNTVDDRVVAMDVTKANQTDMLQAVKSIAYDDSTGTFTITFFNNTTATINTDLEKLAINFDYDDDPTSPYYQHIIIELDDGTVKYIDLSSLITEYEFDDTDTIAISVSNAGVVSADVIDGSITGQKLQPNYLADITVQANNASASATRANDSELESEAWAVGTRNGQPVPNSHPAYHNNAYWWSQKANVTSLVSLTDVEIDLDTLADGQLFGYDGTLEKWTNVNAPATGAVPHVIVLSEAGSTVRLEKGTTTIYATETSAEHFECDLEMQNPKDIYGVWTIHAVLDGDDAMMSLNVDTIKVYVVDDSHMHADITVTYPNGATVSCSMTGAPTQYATESPYTFVVHSYGVWRITGTRGGVTEIHDVTIYENGQEEEVTLSLIPEGSTVTPTDDIQLWLACAGIEDKPYTMLQQVLADSATLLKVLTNDNASDYLARSTTWATGITADSNAMAIIGSYDYCTNVLLDSGSTWVTAIANSAYATSVINTSNPNMTSDTTPSGEVVCNSYQSGYEGYKAFDGDNTTGYTCLYDEAKNDYYIGYKFPHEVKIIKANVRSDTYSASYWFDNAIFGGNAISSLTQLSSKMRNQATEGSPSINSDIFTCLNAYQYFALKIVDSNTQTAYSRGVYWNHIYEIKLYGRENGGAQSWLKAGDIQKSYTQLSQILGDTATLRDLMASNDAVDYLVNAKAFIDDICANQTAMSLIGANDYASDILTSDAEWLNTISNSAYAELVLNVKTPTMTSNTTPKGECISGSYYSSYPNWNAFDKNTATFWASNTVAITDLNDYIGYKFVRPVSVKFFKEMARQDSGHTPLKDYDICGSNDGTNWTILYTNSNEPDIVTGVEVSHPFINNNSYLYYRLYIRSAWRGQRVGISILDFLGREIGGVQTWLRSAGIVNKNYTTISEIANDPDTLFALITNDDAIDYLVTAKGLIDDIMSNETVMQAIGSYDYCADTLLSDSEWFNGIKNSTYTDSVITKVPAMTSDTTPSGKCTASSAGGDQQAFKAFDRSTNFWNSTQASAPVWVQYEFPHDVKVYQAEVQFTSYASSSTVQIQKSDGTELSESVTISGTTKTEIDVNGGQFNAYRMYVSAQTKSSSYAGVCQEVQFYGRQNAGVQSWLRAGNITDKTYTTLTEVLADTTTLSALIASHDAVDYLVTAKGLIDGITSDATAMSYIGLNNYCANTLLADAEWLNAINNSTYKESVLNVKNPTMTSDTTPSGKASASAVYDASHAAWMAFDGTTAYGWCKNGATGWLKYEFPSAVSIKYAHIVNYGGGNFGCGSIEIQGSNDDSTWTTLKTYTLTNGQTVDLSFVNSDSYKYYRLNILTATGGYGCGITEMVYYGREDV